MKRGLPLLAAVAAVSVASWSSAAVLLSDGFDTAASSTGYNTFVTAGATGPSGDATFGYNYGAAPGSGGLSIPVAPHTTDGSTTGLRVRTDNLQSSSGTVVGATSVITKGLTLPSTYTVQVDVWSNYIGNGTDISSSGSNGTTGVAVGVGTSGTSNQYVAANDGLLTEGFGDNGAGANQAYRIYTDNTHPNPTTAGYWAAGTSSTSASNTDPYYTAFLPSVSAPSGQSSFLATQGGSSAAGTLGFAWHTWTISNDGTNLTWAIDGHTIGTVPDSAVTFGGSQVSLGNDDTGLSGNSSANNQLFNAEIFDNLKITDTAVPEPASIGLLAFAALPLLRRRRKA